MNEAAASGQPGRGLAGHPQPPSGPHSPWWPGGRRPCPARTRAREGRSGAQEPAGLAGERPLRPRLLPTMPQTESSLAPPPLLPLLFLPSPPSSLRLLSLFPFLLRSPPAPSSLLFLPPPPSSPRASLRSPVQATPPGHAPGRHRCSATCALLLRPACALPAPGARSRSSPTWSPPVSGAAAAPARSLFPPQTSAALAKTLPDTLRDWPG